MDKSENVYPQVIIKMILRNSKMVLGFAQRGISTVLLHRVCLLFRH